LRGGDESKRTLEGVSHHPQAISYFPNREDAGPVERGEKIRKFQQVPGERLQKIAKKKDTLVKDSLPSKEKEDHHLSHPTGGDRMLALGAIKFSSTKRRPRKGEDRLSTLNVTRREDSR